VSSFLGSVQEGVLRLKVEVARDANMVGFRLALVVPVLDFELFIHVTQFDAELWREHVLCFDHIAQAAVELHVVEFGRAAAAQLRAGDVAQAGAQLPLLVDVVEDQGFNREALELHAAVLRALVVHMEACAGLCGKLLVDTEIQAAGEVHAAAGPDAGGVAVGVLGGCQFIAACGGADPDKAVHRSCRDSGDLGVRGGGDCQCREGERSFFHAGHLFNLLLGNRKREIVSF